MSVYQGITVDFTKKIIETSKNGSTANKNDLSKLIATLAPVKNNPALPDVSYTNPDYIEKSLNQILLGNYSNDLTLLGTLGQLGLSFTGIDWPADLRDISSDIVNWETSFGHVGQTVLDGIGLIPVVGMLKYGDEVGQVLKNTTKITKELNIADRSVKIVNDIENITNHGIDQIITRGIKPEYIKYTIEKPTQYIEKIDKLGRKSYSYISDKAVLIFNETKNLITGWLQ
jgi:hypothetical protein